MNAVHPWDQAWERVGPLGGGGQGLTVKMRSRTNAGLTGVLKTLKQPRNPQARRRMYVEAAHVRLLSAEAIKVPRWLDLTLINSEDPSRELFFVMEFIDGKTLEEVVASRGRLGLEQAGWMVLDLARTVAAAHRLGIGHRDLKPKNILVRTLEPADLVIVDFGLSFNRDRDEGLTRPDEHVRNRFLSLGGGTVPGGERRDLRHDVTARTAILSYCLTGHEPGLLGDDHDRPPHQRAGATMTEVLGGGLAQSMWTCCSIGDSPPISPTDSRTRRNLRSNLIRLSPRRARATRTPGWPPRSGRPDHS